MLRKFFLTFGVSILILIANFIGGVLTARFLGPSGRGELAAVTLWPSMLASIGSLGLVEAIVYFAGKNDRDELSHILGSTLLAGLIQSILLIGTGFLILPVLMSQHRSEVVAITRIYLLFIPLNLISQYLLAVFQGRLRMGIFNLVRFLVSASYTAVVLILAFLGRLTVLNAALTLLGSNLLIILLELAWLRKLGWLRLHLNTALLRRMLAFGIKAHLGNLSSMLNLRLDQMIMAALLEPAFLGLYVVAVTVSGGVNLISYATASLAFPSLSAASGRDQQAALLARFLRLCLWGSALTALALVLLLPWLLPLIFGENYRASIPVARVLTFAAVISGVNSVLASGMKGTGYPLASTYSELCGLVVTAAGLYLLLPAFQILGAAIASLLAYCASFLLLFILARRALGFSVTAALLLQPEDLSSLLQILRQAGDRSRAALARLSG